MTQIKQLADELKNDPKGLGYAKIIANGSKIALDAGRFHVLNDEAEPVKITDKKRQTEITQDVVAQQLAIILNQVSKKPAPVRVRSYPVTQILQQLVPHEVATKLPQLRQELEALAVDGSISVGNDNVYQLLLTILLPYPSSTKTIQKAVLNPEPSRIQELLGADAHATPELVQAALG